jgi:hypothetical protein
MGNVASLVRQQCQSNFIRSCRQFVGASTLEIQHDAADRRIAAGQSNPQSLDSILPNIETALFGGGRGIGQFQDKPRRIFRDDHLGLRGRAEKNIQLDVVPAARETHIPDLSRAIALRCR